MSDKLLTRIILPYVISAVVLIVPGIIFLLVREVIPPAYARDAHPADYIIIASAAVYTLVCVLIRLRQRRWLNAFIEGVEDEVEDTVRYSVRNHPLPICVVNSEGKLMLTNDRFKEYFPDAKVLKTDISEVTGFGKDEFEPHEDGIGISISANGKNWLVLASYLNEDSSKSVLLYFIDATEYEELKTRYADEKMCFCYVSVDNYEDILSKSKDEKKPIVAASIETTVREWGAELDAIVIRNAKDKYHLLFDTTHFRAMEDGKFAILDKVREIETDAEFPASLSIGAGEGGSTLSENEKYAAFALDLALGRGGDQAAVRTADDVRYYGGKIQVLDSRNKGKSRVMTHALKRLISQSTEVVIMGHRSFDMDALGSALGIYRIAFAHGKPAHIVRGEIDHSMQDVFDAADRSGSYDFVGSEDAIKLTKEDTLLVIVDAHTAGMVECPKLISLAQNIVVIDHHRKMKDFIDNATLTFMEPGASSASELIAELMQYDDKVIRMNKLEANIMLAGILVDTNNFSVKTGIRTFEAASWLKSKGADSMAVRELLQSDMADFKQRANIIANAEFTVDGIAISRDEGIHQNAQVIVAQAADELLDVKGIKASFVVGETKKGVVVSARSLGSVNVQVIMEKFGGGGHLTMAAAQIPGATQDEVIADIRKYISETDR